MSIVTDAEKLSFQKWAEDLQCGRLGGEPSLFDLGLVCDAIAASPYSFITDAMLRINGGFLPRRRYDCVMTVLVQDGVLTPEGFNRFRIKRSKIPALR